MGATSVRMAIVEGDPCQAEAFTHWLKLAGHCCHHFAHGEALLRLFDRVSIDALLLDWNLPRLGAVDVLKQIRRSDRASLPVLLVSRRSQEDHIVRALRQGADDYLIKPVRRLELLARLEAIARRGKRGVEPSSSFEVGAIHVDCQGRTLLLHGREVEMTAKGFELSVLFLRNVGRLLSRGSLALRQC
jgi:two-component system response regulator RegX3